MGVVALSFIGFPSFSLLAHQELADDLFGVSFPTAKDGWACGRWGTIVYSGDSGLTWNKQESGTDFTLSSIYFVDSKNGWAVGDGGTIIHTTDGGKSWKKQASPVPFFLMDLHFSNAQKGWIVTERTNILYTGDGGNTWQMQFKDKDFVLKSISFCDELNGWAAGEYGFIYHTSNGGVSWEHQTGEFGFSEETGEVVGGDYLFDVVAINPLTAWVAGIDGYVAKTSDGGKTWEQVREGIPTEHLLGIASDREGAIIIVGNGSLLSSSDWGEDFSAHLTDRILMYGWLNGITYNGTGRFIAAGKRGWVYLTDDKGSSWRAVTSQ